MRCVEQIEVAMDCNLTLESFPWRNYGIEELKDLVDNLSPLTYRADSDFPTCVENYS